MTSDIPATVSGYGCYSLTSYCNHILHIVIHSLDPRFCQGDAKSGVRY
jgi:hypothetical protein